MPVDVLAVGWEQRREEPAKSPASGREPIMLRSEPSTNAKRMSSTKTAHWLSRRGSCWAFAIVLLAAPFAAITQSPTADAQVGVVGAPVTLYLHGAPTGVGQVDVLLAGSTMSPDPPTKTDPSVWYSTPALAGANPNTIHDANWRYQPASGYSFADSTVTITFWALSLGGVLEVNGWNVRLYNDGLVVAERLGGGDFVPSTPGIPAEYTLTFDSVDAVGTDLTLQINPQFADVDFAHILLFDSVDFPSRVEFASGADTTPPSQVTGLTANATSSTISLEWSAAFDNVGIDHYVVRRGTESGILSSIAQPSGTSYLDAGRTPNTTYYYQVSAVDAAGNEGSLSSEVSTTTLSADTTAPVIGTVSFEAGATVLTVSWTTDEPTTGIVDYGTTSAYGKSATSARGTSHAVSIANLGPGQTYHLRVTASDDAGNNASTSDLVATTTLTQVFYLHNVGPAFVEFMNEVNSPGDNDGRGWNVLGTGLATLNHQTGTTGPLGEVADIYPAQNPANAGVLVNGSSNATGTIYVNFPTSGPTVGTVHPETVGVDVFSLTLFANGNDVIGTQTVVQPLLLDAGWVPVNFSFPLTTTGIDRGTLRAEFRAQAGTTAYRIGYEGDHASQVTIPVQAGLPLQAEIGILTSAPHVEDVPVSFDGIAAGGVAPYQYRWHFEGGGKRSTLEDPTHTFKRPGEWTVTLTVRDAANNRVTTDATLHVLQRDFVDAPRAVVAIVDTGVNPYHPTYSRPNAEMPFADFADATNGNATAQVLDLADSGTYAERAIADEDTWDSIGIGEFVYFNNTNVFGVSFHDPAAASAIGTQRIRDINGHGTATTSTALASFPNAIIVLVQPTVVGSATGTGLTGDSLTASFEWAVAQPWIDVISLSAGAAGNLPLVGPESLPALTKEAVDSGKVVVISAGNDPSPLPSDRSDGPPWVISVTGSQADGQAKEILSSNIYPDYSADYTVLAAVPDSADDAYASISGTSFSCPVVAGVIAGILHGVRSAVGYDDGIVEGALAPGVTNWNVRDALNKTALIVPYQFYTAGIHANGDHAHVPLAEFLTAGWGEVDASIIDETVSSILSDDYTIPAQKTITAIWKGITYQYRETYWNVDGASLGADVPGPELDVHTIPTIETAHPYPANADLTWNITWPGANAVSVHFEDFDVETGFDFVSVEDPAGNVYGIFSLEGGASFWSPYVPGDTVTVRLVSDSLVETFGFVIHEIDVV